MRARRYPVFPLFLLAVLALPLAGCAMTFNTRTLGVPVTMAEPLAQPVPGDTFTVTGRAVHLLWGLAPAKQPSLQHMLANQLGPGAGVHNLSIRTRKTFTDVLFTVFTVGIISPTSVTFSGVIARSSP